MSLTSIAQPNFWQQTNGPYGAVEVTALTTAPNGHIYAGIENSGIYKSTNGGNQWTITGVHPLLKHTESILTTPNGYIFANNGYNSSNGGGITRSTDEGATWTTIFSLDEWEAITMARNINGSLFLSGANGSHSQKLYRSTNYGDTWTIILTGNCRGVATDIHGYVFVAKDTSILRSTDNGDNWNSSSIGLGGSDILYLYPTFQGSIIATAENLSFTDTVFISRDTGVSWTGFGKSIAYYFSDPHGISIFRSSYYAIQRTTDDGLSWTTPYYNSSSNHVYTLAFDSSGHLLATANFGVLRSTDLGNTWDTISTGFIAQMTSSLFSTSDHITFASSNRSGTFRSSNGGNSWTPVASLPYMVEQFAEHPNGNLFATHGGNLYRSTDRGISWTSRPINDNFSYPYYLAIDSFGTVFASGSYSTLPSMWSAPRIWRTTDEGLMWTIVSSPSPSGLFWYPKAFLRSPQGHFFACFWGYSSSLFLRSIDDGVTWIEIANGFPSNDYATTLLSTSTDQIFAGTSSHGLFMSTDDGTNWYPTNFGLTDINAIAVNRFGHLFIGTNSAGVFRSNDGGNEWFTINSNLPDLCVLSLSIDTDGYLLVGTRSCGVWRSLSPTTDVHYFSHDTPFFFSLYQNYPNPFNPITTIKFQIPSTSFVILKVFDLLGKELSTLVNEKKSAGEYQVLWNGHGFSSGVYFYRLTANDFVETKRFVLLK
jgi:photosystem II stability/assembly factor-like uncharacterized protein